MVCKNAEGFVRTAEATLQALSESRSTASVLQGHIIFKCTAARSYYGRGRALEVADSIEEHGSNNQGGDRERAAWPEWADVRSGFRIQTPWDNLHFFIACVHQTSEHGIACLSCGLVSTLANGWPGRRIRRCVGNRCVSNVLTMQVKKDADAMPRLMVAQRVAVHTMQQTMQPLILQGGS